MIHAFRFHVFGGEGRVRFAGISLEEAQAVAADSVVWLRERERCWSRFQPDSQVSRLNRGATVEPDEVLLEILATAQAAHRQTGGRIDVTAFPLWKLWHETDRDAPPTLAEIRRAQALCGCHEVGTDPTGVRLPRPGMALDLGGLGKEWCVDGLVARLEQRGLEHFLIELAGDVAGRGRQSARHEGWWVLLPGNHHAILLRDAAVATSGHGARCRLSWGTWISHLIDAETGWPASGAIRSATAVAGTCLDAGLAASDAALAKDVATAFARLGGRPGLVRSAAGRLIADVNLTAASAVVECGPLAPTSLAVPREAGA